MSYEGVGNPIIAIGVTKDIKIEIKIDHNGYLNL
jgi:hypothetical protein